MAKGALEVATQKFVFVHDVRGALPTEVNDEVEVRAQFSVINNGIVIELEAPFKITRSMPASQREAAMVASINNELVSYGISITAADLAWPWFR